jgi:hypothetical protein
MSSKPARRLTLLLTLPACNREPVPTATDTVRTVEFICIRQKSTIR